MVQSFLGGETTASGRLARGASAQERGSGDTTGSRRIGSSGLPIYSMTEQVGADFDRHPRQFQTIIAQAEREGLSIEVLAWEAGMLEFRKERQILMRLSIGPGSLEPGCWESKVGTVIAQVQIAHLVQQQRPVLLACKSIDYDSSTDAAQRALIEALAATLCIEPHRLSLRMNQFPGAEQIQLFFEDAQLASLIQNPVLGLVLEFRLNFSVIGPSAAEAADPVLLELYPDQIQELYELHREEFEVLSISAEKIAEVRSEIATSATLLDRGILELAQRKQLRVLGIGDTQYGFGDPNRRFGISLLRRLQHLGFTHFAIPAPKRESERIEAALNNGTFRRVWLEIASRSTTARLSAEWTALIQRAHDVGFKVVAVGSTGPETNSAIAAGVLDILLPSEDAKVLLWLDTPALARGLSPHGGCTVGELLQRSLGPDRIQTVAAVTGQVPGATLKLFTEGPTEDAALLKPVLLETAQCRSLASIPWTLNSQIPHSAWDYVALYPGSIEPTQRS